MNDELLPFERGHQWSAGDAAFWLHVPRGGWGYIERVPCTVVRVTEKRVTIRIRLAGGAETIRSVAPLSLEPTPSPTRETP